MSESEASGVTKAAEKLPKKRGYFATVPPAEILPIIDREYRSNVKGIYAIGDVTGMPLVKVAANQGVDVIEKMRRRGAFGKSRSAPDDTRLDLVIIGAGPAGLSAAIEAERLGIKCVVLERARVANTIREFPAGKTVYAEPRHLENRGRMAVDEDLDRDEFLAMVDQAVEDNHVNVIEGVEVRRVRKSGNPGFEIEASDGRSFAAPSVIIAVGRQGESRRLDVPGVELPGKVAYRLHAVDDYLGKDVLVVGGGNSAVEAALTLSDKCRVTLSYRKDEFFRLKAENRRAVDEAIRTGCLTVLFQSNLREIHPAEALIEVDGQARAVANDQVLILIGTLPPIEFLLDAGLQLDGVWTLRRVLGCLGCVFAAYLVYFQAKHFTFVAGGEGDGPRHVPGMEWLFELLPDRFANLYSFYYLLYFASIAGFGLYWGFRTTSRIIWRRNLSNIFFNWTLWWGLPTLMVIWFGPNAWTPLMNRLVNAWPLNTAAFTIEPIAGRGDPAWWTAVGVLGVAWAVVLTFVVLPLFTVLVGKHYCSHVCSCGALAETVGNWFRHRGPKGDPPRWLERLGFAFVPLVTMVAVLELFGRHAALGYYNVIVGTFLAGVLAIGVYPFLGQRIWCRFWCPLAFWMNFWGRWSRFKISSVPGRCIDCNICNQYCQMGIDIKSRALQGKPVTLHDSPCVACGECVVRCPMGVLHLGKLPTDPLPSTNQKALRRRALGETN